MHATGSGDAVSAWSDTLDALMRERGRALYGYAFVLAGSADAADDLLQEALVRAFKRGRGPESLEAAHAYVKRAMQTALIDAHRRASARPQRDHREADRVAPDPTGASSTRDALLQAVQSLPPRERTCVVMRYFDGLSSTAIAADLGLSAGTVRGYLSTAIATLQRTYGDFGLDPADALEGGDEHVVIMTKGGTR
ncbi:RNA polymerase sigma factor [Demequina iriomotensis]|uniref:RNA polymerase sigma factor n=1 Tax=Demequina iriomotensis TaxID=1536641 RepID=UPI000782A0DC|nr:sigma-70 family RNA polymerase sigma factor [Demequina iriomotensis]